MRMVALKQPYLTYRTRRMLPGEEFDVKPGYGRLLKKLGRAMDAPTIAEQPTTAAPAEPQPKSETEIDTLRTEATALGLTIDQRWGARRLRTAIDNAKAKML